jgi:hypothetical protein
MKFTVKRSNNKEDKEFKQRIYLTIRSRDLIKNIPDLLIYKYLNKDLIIVLKSNCDNEDNRLFETIKSKQDTLGITGLSRYILNSDIKKYNISKEEIFKIAIKNFDNLNIPLDIINSKKDIIIVPKWDVKSEYGEDIIYSHLLSKKSINLLKKKLGSQFYIRLSNYETFIAFNKGISKENWSRIKNISLDSYNKNPHPLSNKLYLFSNKRLILSKEKY